MNDFFRRAAWLPWLLVAASSSGCVTVYQPLVALQRPVAIDPQVTNFQGLRLLVRCVSDENLKPSQADRLCRNVSTLFTNQGATVELEVPRGNASAARDPAAKGAGASTKPDLVMELKSRLLHEENSALLWVLSIASATLLPAITDTSISQDVTIRDSDGFLLVADALQARFVRYFSVAVWAVNGVLDLLVREPSDRVTGNSVNKEVSKDLYGQLSQLVLHARLRSEVLGGFANRLAPAPAPQTSPASQAQ